MRQVHNCVPIARKFHLNWDLAFFHLYEKGKNDDITIGKRNTYMTSPSNWLIRMCSRTHTTTSDSIVSPNLIFVSVDCSYGNRFRIANVLSNIRVEITEKGSACRVCVLWILESVVDVVTSAQYNQTTARNFLFFLAIVKHAHTAPKNHMRGLFVFLLWSHSEYVELCLSIHNSTPFSYNDITSHVRK